MLDPNLRYGLPMEVLLCVSTYFWTFSDVDKLRPADVAPQCAIVHVALLCIASFFVTCHKW